jgi:hypothetical protein
MIKRTVLVAFAATLVLSGCIENGNGEKVGQITKVSKEGAVCPTWEAEIIRGGFNGGSGVQGQAFHFTIENNDALLKQVQDAMNNQQEVKIHYRSEMATLCRSEHDNFLVGIEIVKPQADKTRTTASSESVSPVAGSITDPDVVELLQVQAKLINRLVAKINR